MSYYLSQKKVKAILGGHYNNLYFTENNDPIKYITVKKIYQKLKYHYKSKAYI